MFSDQPVQQLPFIVSLALTIGVACSILWLVSEVGRRAAIRGSAHRYFYSSVELALRWPAFVYFVISAVVELQFFRDPLLTITSAAGAGVWLFIYVTNKRMGYYDDDNFWTAMKKKLQSMGRAPAPSLT